MADEDMTGNDAPSVGAAGEGVPSVGAADKDDAPSVGAADDGALSETPEPDDAADAGGELMAEPPNHDPGEGGDTDREGKDRMRMGRRVGVAVGALVAVAAVVVGAVWAVAAVVDDDDDRYHFDDNDGDDDRDDGYWGDGHRGDGDRDDGYRGDGHRGDGDRDDGYRADGNRGDRYRDDGDRGGGYRDDGDRGGGYRDDGDRGDGYRGGGDRGDGYDRNRGERDSSRRGSRSEEPPKFPSDRPVPSKECETLMSLRGGEVTLLLCGGSKRPFADTDDGGLPDRFNFRWDGDRDLFGFGKVPFGFFRFFGSEGDRPFGLDGDFRSRRPRPEGPLFGNRDQDQGAPQLGKPKKQTPELKTDEESRRQFWEMQDRMRELFRSFPFPGGRGLEFEEGFGFGEGFEFDDDSELPEEIQDLLRRFGLEDLFEDLIEGYVDDFDDDADDDHDGDDFDDDADDDHDGDDFDDDFDEDDGDDFDEDDDASADRVESSFRA